MGDGYTVEAQLTQQEVTGGLQFEVTPRNLSAKQNIHVQAEEGRGVTVRVRLGMTIAEVKAEVEARMLIPSTQFRLVFNQTILDDSKCLMPVGTPIGV